MNRNEPIKMSEKPRRYGGADTNLRLIAIREGLGLSRAELVKHTVIRRCPGSEGPHPLPFGGFARTEGQKGRELYTPVSIVRLLAEIIEPFDGCILRK